MRPQRSLTSTLILLLVLSLALAAAVGAAPIERVAPGGDLQRALRNVDDGGQILLEAGTFSVPAGGFRVRGFAKSFEIRAVPRARPVLDGGGTTPIFLLEDGSDVEVRFRKITFANGFSNVSTEAAGVTVRGGATAIFTNCIFEGNHHDDSGGGAVQVRGSEARFSRGRVSDNTALRWGPGIYALESSKVTVGQVLFQRNRNNLPNHQRDAVGAAIYVLDSELTVNRSRFKDNEAAWVGGAIYAFGTFDNPPTPNTPSTMVSVNNSTFVSNIAEPDPCCPVPGPTGGGAIHAEDDVELSVRSSRFRRNVGTFGGAINQFRSSVEVRDSLFVGNNSPTTDRGNGTGGAINLTSSDFVDPSTDFGAINRPSASIDIRDSLFQGRSGNIAETAQSGGCIFAQGDNNRIDGGNNGVPPMGTLAENRAVVQVRRSIFFDCDVVTSDRGRGLGGAFFLNIAELDMDGSLVMASDALGQNGTGGAIMALGRDLVKISDSTFADNSAEARGGAIQLRGGELDLRDSRFLRNDVSPSDDEPVQRSPGAALTLTPADGNPVTGQVEDCDFTDNIGIPIVDVDGDEAPFNLVTYARNTFHSTLFDGRIYKNQAIGFGGMTADELNDLVVVRANGSRTVKSPDGGNDFSDQPLELGHLVAAPPAILDKAAPGDGPPVPASLGGAWNGARADLDGADLEAGSFVVEIEAAGEKVLSVEGREVDRATVE